MNLNISSLKDSSKIRSLTISELLLSTMLRMLPIKHGKHRLMDIYFPKAWNKSGRDVFVKYRGVKLRINIDELIGWHFAILKSFDPEVSEILYRISKDDDEQVFWDIGANKCTCSYGISYLLPNAKIVAIEPQTSLRESNLLNLEQTCRNRFEYFEVGIGEQNEKLELVIPSENIGRATLHAKSVGENDKTEIIEIVTADQIAKQSKYGWPTLVKLDVEGHELAVIKSLSEALEKKICKAMVFENHFREKDNFIGIKDIADKYGYSLYAIKKTVFSTKLVKTTDLVAGVTDYVILLD